MALTWTVRVTVMVQEAGEGAEGEGAEGEGEGEEAVW